MCGVPGGGRVHNTSQMKEWDWKLRPQQLLRLLPTVGRTSAGWCAAAAAGDSEQLGQLGEAAEKGFRYGQ